MRISDWSSDVCSSDLYARPFRRRPVTTGGGFVSLHFFGCFMLQQMRSGAASWIAKGLMVLLVLSFGAWGVADYIRNFNTGGDVAKVGDQSITQAEFYESWRLEVASIQRRFAPNFTADNARHLGRDETRLNPQ